MVGRGIFTFALLVTAGLTLILGRPASSQRSRPALEPIVVSEDEAETMIRTETLRRGEALAQVLARQGLTPNQAAEAITALRDYINPRVLQPGVTVQVERTPWDSLLGVAVRYDADHIVRLTPFEGAFVTEREAIPVRVDTLLLTGSINSSLYNSVIAVRAVGMSTQERIERLMWGLYRPFQWSIDFSVGLRKGDRYRAVYERHVRSDGSIRHSRVLAAEFTNRGRTYQAYWFGPRGEYFDAEGESMKRLFLKAPVEFHRISSRFTRRRYHPSLGIYRAHLGTDYASAPGTPVKATADGTVVRASWWGGYGRVVEIRHVNDYNTRYAHLSFIAKGIRPGARVRQNQLIGYVGVSGLTTGPHLHYELRQQGRAIDQRTVNLPSGEPVAPDQSAEFEVARDQLVELLNRAGGSSAAITE